ncbi:MAG: hypothetical protein ACOYU7_01595 [Bacillota bacterium]
MTEQPPASLRKRIISPPLGFAAIAFFVVYALGFAHGYSNGRTDLEGSAKTKAVVREIVENLTIVNENEKWVAWGEAVDKREAVIDRLDDLVQNWDGQDVATLDKMISCLEECVAIDTSVEGPPKAVWYRDEMLAYDRARLEALKLMKLALTTQTGAQQRATLRKAATMENEADKRFADISQRYEKWLKDNGY